MLAGQLFMLLLSFVDLFQNKPFQNNSSSVKLFGSRSGPTVLGPDLVSNCLQRFYQQTTKVAASKERVT